MDSITIISELNKDLECAVCMNLYSRPKSLPCGHSLCEACTQHVFRNLAKNRKLKTFRNISKIQFLQVPACVRIVARALQYHQPVCRSITH
jgi:hypothetical protein